jgi:hypothetical protein
VKKSTRILAGVTIAFTACFAEGGAEVSGRITDARGKPLEGARSKLRYP